MKCNKCGFETAQDYAFCPQCGERLIHDVQPQGTFVVQILAALKDPLFLAVCILLSVSCLMSLLADSVPLLEILATVFLWLIYVQARKGTVDTDHLRCVSGVVYAQYVLNYVIAGLVLVAGVIFAIGFGAISGGVEGFLNTLLADLVGKEEMADALADLAFLRSVPGTLVLFACVIGSTFFAVINVFTYRYLHRFTKSLYQSVEQGVYAVECVKAAKILLFIYGGGSICGSLSVSSAYHFGNFFASIFTAGWAIVAGLLIRYYLDPEA